MSFLSAALALALVQASPAQPVDYRDSAAVTAFLREIGALSNMVSNIAFISDRYQRLVPEPGTEWVFLAATPEGVLMTHRLLGTQSSSEGAGRVKVRLERFQPLVTDGQAYLSREISYDVRCSAVNGRVRLTQNTDYAERGLKGRNLRTPVNGSPMTAGAESPLAPHMRALCEAANQTLLSR